MENWINSPKNLRKNKFKKKKKWMGYFDTTEVMIKWKKNCLKKYKFNGCFISI